MIVCPWCNNEMSDGAGFCSNCGNRLNQAPESSHANNSPVVENPVLEPATDEKPVEATLSEGVFEERSVPERPSAKRKLLKRATLFGGIALASAVVIAAVILLLPENISQLLPGKQDTRDVYNYGLYFKDKELFYSDLKEESTTQQVTTALIDGSEIEDSWLTSAGQGLDCFTYMSEDGSLIFYPDKVDVLDDEGCNLYYRNIKEPESEPVKIDSDIVSYAVNTTATLVTYIKGESGNLYQYSLNDAVKEKISSNVDMFGVSDDGSKIGYLDFEGNIYLKYTGQEKEKIASDVEDIVYLNNDLTTVFYIKDNALYKQVEGEDRIKLATDIADSYSVLKVYDSGEVYYVKEYTETVTLMEYVQDDLKEADSAITMPEAPDYPYWYEYATTEAYNAAYTAYEIAYAEYNVACVAYYEKCDRDILRTDLENKTIARSSYTLCFHNGTEEKVLTESYDLYSCETAADFPVIAYQAYSQTDFEKVRLSEITSISDLENQINENESSAEESYLAIKDSAAQIDLENAQYFRINDAGTIVYFFADISEDSAYGDLYQILIQDGVVGEPELYDSEVSISFFRFYFISEDKFIYFKDVDGDVYLDCGDLYVNKTKIDFDVSTHIIDYCEDLDRLVYYVDYDSEKQLGTLKIYENGTSTKISDDIYDHRIIADGRILYLYDYDIDHYTGELYEWNNDTKRKINDDVIYIVTITDNKYRGNYWF